MSSASTNRWLVLLLVCVAQFMVILDATIVNVALPSLVNGISTSAGALGHKPSFGERASALISGYHLAFFVGCGLMAIAVVLLATLIRKRDVEQIHAEEPMPLAA
jgi:MFS family permease